MKSGMIPHQTKLSGWVKSSKYGETVQSILEVSKPGRKELSQSSIRDWCRVETGEVELTLSSPFIDCVETIADDLEEETAEEHLEEEEERIPHVLDDAMANKVKLLMITPEVGLRPS